MGDGRSVLHGCSGQEGELMEQRPWSEMDPEQFAEGGFSREQWEAYRVKCFDAYYSGGVPHWKNSKGSVMMIHSVSQYSVTWGGVRVATAAETSARAKAASMGLGCHVPDGVFTITIDWECHEWIDGQCDVCGVLWRSSNEKGKCRAKNFEPGLLSRHRVER